MKKNIYSTFVMLLALFCCNPASAEEGATPVTESRTWDFTNGADNYDIVMNSDCWSQTLNKGRSTLQVELDNLELPGASINEPMPGLEGLYFTTSSVVYGVTSNFFMQGSNIKVRIPNCGEGDLVRISFCTAGKNPATVESEELTGNMETSGNSPIEMVSRVKADGDVSLTLHCSNGFRLFTLSVEPQEKPVPRVWDFRKGFSEETVEGLLNSSNWSYDEENNRFFNLDVYDGEEITYNLNGERKVVEECRGLYWDTPELSNYGIVQELCVWPGSKYGRIYLKHGGTSIRIPDVPAGSTVYIGYAVHARNTSRSLTSETEGVIDYAGKTSWTSSYLIEVVDNYLQTDLLKLVNNNTNATDVVLKSGGIDVYYISVDAEPEPFYVEPDETVSIQTINTDSSKKTDYYNLQGQKVNPTKTGIYINRGKKIFVKLN